MIRLIVCLLKDLFYHAIRDDKSPFSDMVCQIKKVVVNLVWQFSIITITFLLVCTDCIHNWFLVAVCIVACCYCNLEAVSYFHYECVENVAGLYK
jgi:hypothetical protein